MNLRSELDSRTLSLSWFIVSQDMTVRNPGKLQNHNTEDLCNGLCLLLNCTSPCTNPLSQLYYMLFIVVAHFISAIPIGRLLHYTKIQWAQSPWPRAQININSDKNITQWLLMFVMLLWVYIHTGQAWKICLATVGFEPTRCGYTLRVTSQTSYSPEYTTPT
jgi:hypothetical protein